MAWGCEKSKMTDIIRRVYNWQKQVNKIALLVVLVMLWWAIGPNMFGFEKVEAAISIRNGGVGTTAATGATTADSIVISKPTGKTEGDAMVVSISALSNNVISAPDTS